MKHIALTLSALVALAIAAPPAHSQIADQGAVAINWDQCYGDGPISNKIFACDTNAGSDVLVVSATPFIDLPEFNGMAAIIDLLALQPSSLSSWWHLETGGCRGTNPSQLSLNLIPPAGVNCMDPWLPGAAGGAGYTANLAANPSLSRIRVVAAIPGSNSLVAGQQYFVARVILNHERTVGIGACTGCTSPMCLFLLSVQLTQPIGIGDYTLYLPLPGTESDLLTYQTGAVAHRVINNDCHNSLCDVKVYSCLSVTEVERPTWGAIKSMYR